MNVRRLVDLAVFAPLGAVATLAAQLCPTGGGRATAEPDEASATPAVTPPPGSEPVADRAGQAGALPPAEALPIEGYDYLAASQVIDRLEALTPTELLAVSAYEASHRCRQVVLGRIAQLQS